MIKYLTILSLLFISFSFFISDLKHLNKNHPPYSEDRSKFLADLSGIAYCKYSDVQKWSCDLCKKHTNFINITNIIDSYASIYAYVLYNKDLQEIILTWRGSIDIKNYF